MANTKFLTNLVLLGPTFIKISLNKVLTTWRKKCDSMSITIGDQKQFAVHFTDNQMILAEDEIYIDQML